MFLLTPVPNTEAAKVIASKLVVSKSVFLDMLPELRTLAFTITGIEDLRTLQRAKDELAKMPIGEVYNTEIKQRLIDIIAPSLGNPKAAAYRAELLMRLHGGQAVAAAQYRVLDRQRDVFPYWMYATHGDGRVRASHAALNGKIFPSNSPFWQLHYPPWEYMCRCKVIPLTQDDAMQIRDQDAKLPPIKRRFMEGLLLDKVEKDHILFDPADDGTTHNITPPSIDNPEKGYRWNPGDIGISLAKLKQGFDPDIFREFEEKAKRTKLSPRVTLWQSLEALDRKKAKAAKPEPAPEVISPAKRAAILKALGMTEADVQNHKAQRTAQLPPLPVLPLQRFTNAQEAKDYFKKTFGVTDLVFPQKTTKWGESVSEAKALEHAQTIAAEWERLLATFPDFPKELHTLMLSKSDRGLAHVDGPAPFLATKMEEWDDQSWERIAVWEKTYGVRHGTERKGSQVADNFRHELGHTISTPARLAAFDHLWRKYKKSGFRKHVSEYSSTKMVEGLADLFGLVTREDYVPGTVPKDMEDFIYNIIRPTP